ncbi:enolase-phosphatase E1-like isoform X3 [Vitis riparia]|uniref:enolase-phosphatase E1-like isoform X3 n=1 Tax=Vitis riparia TaxID=96939 RepID=UPI00155A3109|nr:enolase-phosphatase E1-like isoform X3 [Vitis riparia]
MELKLWRNYLLGRFNCDSPEFNSVINYSGNMLVMVSLSLSSLYMTFKPNVEVKEIKAPAAPEQKVEQVKQTETNLGETKSNTTGIVEIKERATALMTAEIEACRDDRNPEISLHKKIQKEWACAVCQVTTQSEVTLNSHLQGKRHQATSEQLKAKNQATKGNGSPSASMAKISDQSTKEEQPECTSNNLNSKNNGISAASTVKKPDETKDDERQKCASSNGPNQKNNKEWACALCQFTTQSDATLNSHLQGKRHQATSEQLKAKNQATKINGTPSASMAKISDQSTKEEQPKCTSNNLNCKNNGISAASTVKKPDETKDDKRQKCASSNGPNQKNKKVWACALCQVTTQSEATLNSHLQGKRHQATSEQQLKAKNQATKTNGSPSASMAKKSDGSTKEEQPKCTSNNLNSKNNGIPAASTVKKPDKTKDDERQKCASSNGSNQKNKKVWSCALCQVTTQSEATLNSHLQGKRHQATSEQLKAKNQAIKTNGSPSASMAKKSDGSTKEEQPKCTSNNLNSKNNGISAASTVKKPDKTKDDEQQKCASSNGPNQKNNKKWACALCQVTTQSEATLNSHLQGKRHQATSEQLKGKNKATKASGSPSASMAKKSDQSTKEEQLKCTSNNLNSKNNGISAASKVKKPDDTKDDERQKCASSNERNQKNNKKQEKALVPETNEQGHQKNLKQTGDGMKELGSWCNICNVSCTSELDMASHLNGRRHFDSIKQLSELWCSNCNVKCNSEVDMASHQNGRRHLEQLKERLGLWCSICSVSCNSKVDMDSHLNGRRHLDQIEEQLRFWCGACNLMCNSELKMASHLNRRSHLKTMRNI